MGKWKWRSYVIFLRSHTNPYYGKLKKILALWLFTAFSLPLPLKKRNMPLSLFRFTPSKEDPALPSEFYTFTMENEK